MTALQTAGVLNREQARSLLAARLDLGPEQVRKGTKAIHGVGKFLEEVGDLLRDGVLTRAQAAALRGPGNLLLQSVTRR